MINDMEKRAEIAAKYKNLLDAPWGLEVGPGWLDLVEQLLAEISVTAHEDRFRIVQVKEKFGELRVYSRHGNEAIYKLIDAAETKSRSICEACGGPGTVRSGGWIRTSCDPCELARK